MNKNKRHVLNEDLFQHMMFEEGLKLKPYLDTKGVPTIAIGNTYYLDGTKVKMSDKPLSKIQAMALGRITITDFAAFVDSVVSVELNRNQFNACVSMCYNIGKAGFKGSTALRLINSNSNNPKIHDAFMMWTKDKELIPRRKREANLYFKK